MKNEFPGFYDLPDDEYKALLESAYVVFDTNVLLNVYRYSESASKEILDAFEGIKDRLFLPYRIVEEYHENLFTVFEEIQHNYQKLLKELENAISQLKHKGKHPVIQEVLIGEHSESIDKVYKDIECKIADAGNLFKNNDKKERIATIFEGKIGENYNLEKLYELKGKAEIRFANKIPLGYNDAKKNVDKRYGDFIIWMQMIEFAQNKCNLIFVTEDKKDDWFLVRKGITIRPRPELIKEFFDETKKRILIMNFESYSHLLNEFKATTISEIKDIGSSNAEKELYHSQTSETNDEFFTDDEDSFFGIGRNTE